MQTISDIRKQLIEKYQNNEFVIDKTGVKTLEIIGATFLVDEEYIIKKPDLDYMHREHEWYMSESLNVNDIPGKVPDIWKKCADENGFINSNYGYLVFNSGNHNQYANTLLELQKNPDSRRAIIIYNRPSMHYDYKENGKNEFVCTLAQQFFIRNNKLVMHVTMRSNDFCFGSNYDFNWFKYVQSRLAADLGIDCGDYIHTVGSGHLYERHFKFLEEWIK
mgnify:CR=1 FL=1